MKIYLAHNFAARAWLPQEIMKLERMGHLVTSSWITDDSHISTQLAMSSALVDLADIDRADGLLLYVDQFGLKPGKGKFLELGYALGLGKQCFIIGDDDSSVFYSLPQITRIKNYTEIPL